MDRTVLGKKRGVQVFDFKQLRHRDFRGKKKNFCPLIAVGAHEFTFSAATGQEMAGCPSHDHLICARLRIHSTLFFSVFPPPADPKAYLPT
jgi:hypothetical protein